MQGVSQGGEAPSFFIVLWPADCTSKFCKHPVSQAAVRPFFVVVRPPGSDFPPWIKQARKATRVQTFIPQLPMETLDIGVLQQLARLDVHDFNLSLQVPRQQMTAGELRSAVSKSSARIACSTPGCDHFIQHPLQCPGCPFWCPLPAPSTPACRDRPRSAPGISSRSRRHHARNPA